MHQHVRLARHHTSEANPICTSRQLGWESESGLAMALALVLELAHPDNAEHMSQHTPCERAHRQSGTDSHMHCRNHLGNQWGRALALAMVLVVG